MKKGLLGILIGVLLLPALFAGPVLAEGPPTHPSLTSAFGSFNTTNARMWSVNLATWQRTAYYEWVTVSITNQEDDLLTGVEATFYAPRQETGILCSYGIGGVSPLSLRPSVRRMWLIGFDADVEEQEGSGDAIAYMSLLRMRYYRDGTLRDVRGPIMGVSRDGNTGATSVFLRNVKLDWIPNPGPP